MFKSFKCLIPPYDRDKFYSWIVLNWVIIWTTEQNKSEDILVNVGPAWKLLFILSFLVMGLTAATIQTQTNINQDYYNRQRWERKRIAITSDLLLTEFMKNHWNILISISIVSGSLD